MDKKSFCLSQPTLLYFTGPMMQIELNSTHAEADIAA